MEINVPEMLKKLALNFVPDDKRQALEQAINKAKEALSTGGENPADVLAKNGVPTEFLQKIKSNLNTPKATNILSFLGIQTQDAEAKLDELINGGSASATPQSLPSQARVNYGNVVTQEQKNELMNKLRRGLKNF